ncbi:GLPGLI family protein [Neolewinella persica]|uniref:GLPGLI family protein n=1 Tax=Neolewinella persica TaxID=70998 RepID=UPI00037860A7|nr:GLPGLI family protein [Neolewinella persica]
MKNVLLLLICLFSVFALTAQVSYGTIDYIRTVERSLKIEGMEENKEIQAMIAKMAASGAFTENFQATFGPEGFTFIQQVKEVSEMESEIGGGGTIVIATGGDDPSHYSTNTKTGQVLNTDYIFDKSFLISGKVPELKWELTGESIPPSDATIGLDLKVATAITDTGDTITAHYAPSIPVQVGPDNIYGLPGAIMVLQIPQEDGLLTYRAVSMQLSAEPLELVKPTEGKKISREKFRAEKEKRKKMMTRTVIRG